MNKDRITTGLLLGLCLLISQPSVMKAEPVGFFPIPIFTDVHIQSNVKFEPATGFYTYAYTISNPTTNTGNIGDMVVDIILPVGSQSLSSEGLTVPFGITIRSFEEAARYSLPGLMVPVGIRPPIGWTGTVEGRGNAGWFNMNAEEGRINPGTTQSGFEMLSRGLPTIRNMSITPDWVFLVESEETVTEEMEVRADQIREEIILHKKTLGPTAPPLVFDPLVFIETIRGYVTESRSLGWLTDDALAARLTGHLEAAKAAIPLGDIATAKRRLQYFISNLPTPPNGNAACSSECSGLLVFNAQYLLDQLPKRPDLIAIAMSAVPASVAVGSHVTGSAAIRNQGGGAADASTAGLLLSVDAEITPADVSIGEVVVASLTIGENREVSITGVVPSTLVAGSYWVGVCLDIGQAVEKINETNNCMAAGRMITVTPTTTTTTLPSNAMALPLTITNVGTGKGTVKSPPKGID